MMLILITMFLTIIWNDILLIEVKTVILNYWLYYCNLSNIFCCKFSCAIRSIFLIFLTNSLLTDPQTSKGIGSIGVLKMRLIDDKTASI